jgi:hypothetical protein
MEAWPLTTGIVRLSRNDAFTPLTGSWTERDRDRRNDMAR